MNDPLLVLGLLSLGSLVTVGALAGFVAWICRGHRVDLTSVRLVNVPQEKLRNAAFGPYTITPKDAEPPHNPMSYRAEAEWKDGNGDTKRGPFTVATEPKGEDFYEMAKDRSGDE